MDISKLLSNYKFSLARICWLLSIFWLSAIAILAFLWQLGSTGLVDETEPLFAETARQMTVTGNWITPYFNGETRFDKPPLIYWLMAIGYQLIGVNEWAVRLPSAVAAISLMVLGFLTLRYFGFATPAAAKANNNSKGQFDLVTTQRQLWLSAWISAALMGLNIHTIVWGRTGVSDMLLSSCMGMSLFCFFWGYVSQDDSPSSSTNRSRGSNYGHLFRLPHQWYLAFYLFIALAILTKGPVGIVIPGLIILSFLLYVGRFWSVLAEMNPIFGLILILLISLPWYILIFLENGPTYIDSFFGYHNFQRLIDDVNGHDGPWYFYFPIVLGLFAPWSVYLPFSLIRLHLWRRNFWRKQPRNSHLGVFACWWFICIFGFFSICVTKLPSYVLPLIPAGAILVALGWSEALTKSLAAKLDRGLLVSIGGNCFLAIALAIAFWYLPELVGKDVVIPKLGDKVAAAGLPWRGAVVWSAIALASICCWLRIRQRRWIIWINILGFMAFICFVLNPAYIFVDQFRQLSLRELAPVIAEVQQPHEDIWMLGFKKPSLVFYTQRSVNFWKNRHKLNDYFARTGIPSNPNQNVLIVSRDRDLKKIGLYPENYTELDYQGVYKLIRVSLVKVFERLNSTQ